MLRKTLSEKGLITYLARVKPFQGEFLLVLSIIVEVLQREQFSSWRDGPLFQDQFIVNRP